VEQTTVNSFRETLNRLAVEEIKNRPWVGRGVTLTIDDYQLMHNPYYVQKMMVEGDDPEAYPHAASKNWHSTWLGMSATFGIPAGVLWVVLQMQIVAMCFGMRRRLAFGTWTSALLSFCFFIIVIAVLRSWTTGAAVELVKQSALLIGLLCGLKRGMEVAPAPASRLGRGSERRISHPLPGPVTTG
jgi:O-antigen ligase